ncbi:MAG: hypothetical protein ACREBA_00450 [Nitrosotalea sp.]
MKTLAFSVIAISGIIFAGIFFHNAYAPCLMGVSSCGPPPGVTVEIWTDNASYEKNDTITVNGMLYSSNNGTAIPVQLYNPQNILIKTYNAAVNASNKFSLKINGNFNDSGQYVLAACNHGWCDREYVKIIASPYILQDGYRAFPINYRTIADVDNMSVNAGEDSLLIHLSGAPIGSIFKISMPRNLIDSTFANGTDYDFTVLAGENSVQKLMSKANFNETQTSQTSRTLEIKIPSYSQIADMQGEMYVKIIGTKMYEASDLETLSPLQQFKSGIHAQDVKCDDGLILAMKLDYSPACVKESSATKLFLRGWAVGFPDYWVVYLMKSHSTAQILVKYYPNYYGDSAPPDMQVNLHSWVYTSDSSFPTDKINATAKPDFIHTNSSAIVDYTVTAPDTKGVYWLSLSNPCILIPIAVNINQSQLMPSDLQNPGDAKSCPPSETQFHVVGVTNAALKLVRVD